MLLRESHLEAGCWYSRIGRTWCRFWLSILINKTGVCKLINSCAILMGNPVNTLYWMFLSGVDKSLINDFLFNLLFRNCNQFLLMLIQYHLIKKILLNNPLVQPFLVSLYKLLTVKKSGISGCENPVPKSWSCV